MRRHSSDDTPFDTLLEQEYRGLIPIPRRSESTRIPAIDSRAA